MSEREYTPTTDEVRSMFCVGISNPTNPRPTPARAAYAGFDRWLAAYEVEVRERIAQDIEAEASRARHQTWMGGPDRSMAVGDGLDEAAQIAREKR